MKKITPYRVVAKNALMSWNGLSEEEARKVATESTFEELEGKVWAKGSIKYAVAAISTFLGIEDMQNEFEAAVLGQDNPEMTQKQEEVLSQVAAKAKNVNTNDLALYALKCIHDGWVVDYAKKFNQAGREGKKYQHLPLEMIGWTEAKADLLFLEPVLGAIGLELDNHKLMVDYHRDSEKFFKENGFINENLDIQTAKISEKIMEGKKFYPALTDVNTAKTEEEAKDMAGQVFSKVSMSRNYEGKFMTM